MPLAGTQNRRFSGAHPSHDVVAARFAAATARAGALVYSPLKAYSSLIQRSLPSLSNLSVSPQNRKAIPALGAIPRQ